MSTASNRFYVESIEDGSTLHGSLMATKSLSQAYTGSGCVPNWTIAANQPIIYVDLMSGSSRVVADDGGTWYYNGQAITWSGTTSTDGNFEKATYQPTGYSAPVPAIKIVDNIATSANVDTDSITYTGSYTIAGAPITFSMSTFIRITSITASGIFGLIEAIGSNVFTQKGQKIYLRGRLFSADNEEITTNLTTSWTVNGVTTSGTDITVGGITYHNGIEISEGNITDNAVVSCTFSYTRADTSVATYTAYESIDDQTDPEILIIYNSNAEGNSRQLHKDQTVTFEFWMATAENPTTIDTAWQLFKLKLMDSSGSEITTHIDGIPDVVDGYRSLAWEQSPVESSRTCAAVTFTYDTIRTTFKKYMTGYIYAQEGQYSSGT